MEVEGIIQFDWWMVFIVY